MSDRSTNTNRHGIPTLGGTAKPCCWPGCTFGADRNLQLPMCRGHARHTHTAFAAVLNREQADLDARIAAQRQEAVKERELHAVIYYAKIGGHIKIGWTSRLDQRMRAYPPNTELLAVHPGTRADEKKLHQRFAVHRSHGAEWYPLMPVILDHIQQVIAKHGAPPDVYFGARPVDTKRRPKEKSTLRAKYGPMLYG